MNQAAFEQKHKQTWDEFERLLASGETKKGKPQYIDSESRAKFLEIFELVTNNLAMAQTRGYSLQLIAKLNSLVLRGHYVIHSSKTPALGKIRAFFTVGFPSEVRQARKFVLVAILSFVLPALIVGGLIHHDPSYVNTILDPAQIQSIEAMYTVKDNRIGRERGAGTDLMMFGFYIYNNAQIGLTVFVFGVLFCVVTIAVVGFNGIYISAVINHLIVIGLGSSILSFVAGHSAFELTAIVLSGAAGIMLGYALLHPGDLSRQAALRQSGLRAAKIMAGATFMFTLAAFIEAFWSSLAFVPASIKYLVGLSLWGVTISYFLFAGAKDGG